MHALYFVKSFNLDVDHIHVKKLLSLLSAPLVHKITALGGDEKYGEFWFKFVLGGPETTLQIAMRNMKEHNTEICYQYMLGKPELQRKNV